MTMEQQVNDLEKEIAELKGPERLLRNVAIVDLVRELEIREAVSHFMVAPYEKFNIEVEGKKVLGDAPDSGPVDLIIVWD